MLHKEFWGLVFLAFVVWIFMVGDGSMRINRGCRPVAWSGSIVVSVTALVLPKQQSGVKRWVDKVEYGCRYSAWRLFYQDDYNKFIEQQKLGTVPAAPAISAAPSLPSTPASAPPAAEK